MSEPRILISDLAVGESPRWHGGRLWFSHWGTGEIVAIDLDGKAEVVGHSAKPVGYSIDWLPDGRLLVTGEHELYRMEPDGSLVTHADLSHLGYGWNELVVDGRGNIYVNCVGFRFGEEEFRPGNITLITPDGTAREVAGGINFPNGMVITPDNATLIVAESFVNGLTAFDIGPDGSLSNRRVWAAGVGGDGITMDSSGAVWCTNFAGGKPICHRVREGGEVLDRIELPDAGFACMLGGDDGRTLFIMVAEFLGVENLAAMFQSRTGRIMTAPAPVPGAGWP